ncbi:hypothetical protein R3P38DRAFT_1251382 [Favolaschia claudopus]|uniref:Uncharacterized protein n=1 Tax=Favolaschia claudopus TaxID=2862362 RepID=A0AAW0B0Q6_9AGAR
MRLLSTDAISIFHARPRRRSWGPPLSPRVLLPRLGNSRRVACSAWPRLRLLGGLLCDAAVYLGLEKQFVAGSSEEEVLTSAKDLRLGEGFCECELGLAEGQARGRDIDIVRAAGFGVVSETDSRLVKWGQNVCEGSSSVCPKSAKNTPVWLGLVILDVDYRCRPFLAPAADFSSFALRLDSTRAELVLLVNEAEMGMRRCSGCYSPSSFALRLDSVEGLHVHGACDTWE